ADYLTWKKDSLLVKSLTARAENEYGEFLTDKKIPLVVLGKPKGESIPSHITFETFGQSLFSWDNVNHQRILPLFQLNQIFYFENPGKSNIVEAKIIAKEMDIWPGKNALLYKNGMMILKVGEE
ncbi:MAG: hypothetical protein KDC53_05745, partial [Saprospiraceae bacterium]|nr:hypothetical protein [Saprospiraceae bacterium]